MDPIQLVRAACLHAVVSYINVYALGRFFPQVQVVVGKSPELPSRNLDFSVVLDAVGVRVVKRGDAYPPLGTRSRRRGCRGSCSRCWRGRGITLNLEIIGLGAVVVEVTISADPNLVFSTWIRRVIEPENSKATGSCL